MTTETAADPVADAVAAHRDGCAPCGDWLPCDRLAALKEKLWQAQREAAASSQTREVPR